MCIGLQACGSAVETPAETTTEPDLGATVEEKQEPVAEESPARLPVVLGSELTEARYDLQGMKERGVLRVLVGYSHTHYFMDGLNIRGISAGESARLRSLFFRSVSVHRGLESTSCRSRWPGMK